MADTYTFGDSPTAADRLRVLAAVYEPATRDLLGRWAPEGPEHAVDLGCGPGYSTRLLRDVTGARRTTGIERSPEFITRARADDTRGIVIVAHDVADLPLPVPPADLVLARFLLTHLADPTTALQGWTAALRPGGRLIVQETAELSSTDPTFARYYTLVAELQRHHGQDLTIGARLGALAASAGLPPRHVGLRTLEPRVSAMAHLHALNLRTWRRDAHALDAFDADELDEIAHRLDRIATAPPPGIHVAHVLGELVIEA